MTEDEAKKKWCPLTRVGSTETGLGGINRSPIHNVIDGSRCIGRRCMMWRHVKKQMLQNIDTQELQELPRSWDGSKFTQVSTEDKGNGYCGLAGEP